jgi:hypothetical protein
MVMMRFRLQYKLLPFGAEGNQTVNHGLHVPVPLPMGATVGTSQNASQIDWEARGCICYTEAIRHRT